MFGAIACLGHITVGIGEFSELAAKTSEFFNMKHNILLIYFLS